MDLGDAASVLLQRVSERVGPLRRTITGSTLAGGLLLAVMGTATLVLGLSNEAMGWGTGWRVDISSRLRHYGSLPTDALSFHGRPAPKQQTLRGRMRRS